MSPQRIRRRWFLLGVGLSLATLALVCGGLVVFFNAVFGGLAEGHVIPESEQISRFQEHRDDFEGYVQRLRVTGWKSGQPLPPLPPELHRIGIFAVQERDNGKMVLFEWSSHPLDSDHSVVFVFTDEWVNEDDVKRRLFACNTAKRLSGPWFRAVRN